jgi:hypothetical protein
MLKHQDHCPALAALELLDSFISLLDSFPSLQRHAVCAYSKGASVHAHHLFTEMPKPGNLTSIETR